MAKKKGGRVTPKGTTPPPRPTRGPRAATEAASAGQVGRRPSNPAMLAAIGVAWIVCGVIALVSLHASWKLVPGIVFIGVGLFFIRGAAATVLRRERRGSHSD